MKLKPGIYEIPEGYKAMVVDHGTKVVIKERTYRQAKEGDYRCRDCKAQSIGYCFRGRPYRVKVCLLKPKKSNDSRQLFYAAPDNRPVCEKFEKK